MRWLDRLLLLAGVVGLFLIAYELQVMNGHLFEIRINTLDLKNAAWAEANKTPR